MQQGMWDLVLLQVLVLENPSYRALEAFQRFGESQRAVRRIGGSNYSLCLLDRCPAGGDGRPLLQDRT